MPRPLRIEYPGARYHVMGRGNRGAKVFRENRDYEIFLDTLEEAAERTGWLVHAWVLMTTHYHLLLETPEANLVAGMSWLPGTFTQRYNCYHHEWGHLFQGRYKAKLIEDEDPAYFRRVADYIHMNPAAANLLDSTKPNLASYRWSSFPEYLMPPTKRPGWLETREVLASHHILNDTATGRRAFESLMDQQTQWVLREKSRRDWQRQWRQYDHGWIHGSEAFKKRMATVLAEQADMDHRRIYDREQRRSCGEAAAVSALAAAWEVVGLCPDELAALRKGDPRKLLLAGWLRARYVVSRQWVAQNLCLGHSSRVYQGIRFYLSPPAGYKRMKTDLVKISELSG